MHIISHIAYYSIHRDPLFPTVYITVYIEVLFFNLFLHTLASNTVDGVISVRMEILSLGMVTRDLDDVATSLSRHFVASSFD